MGSLVNTQGLDPEKNNLLKEEASAISPFGRASIDLDDQLYRLTEIVDRLHQVVGYAYRANEVLAETQPLYDDAVVSDLTNAQRGRVEKIARLNASITHFLDHVEL